MFPWLRRLLGITEVRPLPIEFEIEENADPNVPGACSVRIFKTLTDGRHLVSDPASLDYGYTEDVEEDGKRVVYRLDPEDAQTLAALRSLNPRREGSLLIFEMMPPQLRHLRQRPNVQEGPNLRSVKIEDHPETPKMQVTFEEGEGVEVQFGYQDEDTEAVEPVDRVVNANDGPYARVGKRFIPLPDDFEDRHRSLLEIGRFSVDLDRVPRFFLRDLVYYQERFDAVLVGDAALVEVIDGADPAARPVIELDASVPGWLEFEVTYQAGGRVIPYAQLREAGESQGFYRVGKHTWLQIDHEHMQRVNEALLAMGAQPEEGRARYRLPSHQFADLEAFITAIGGRRVASDAYRAFLEQLTGFEARETFHLPDAMEAQLDQAGIALRPYQRSGIHWLDWLGQHQLHGLLADDMGLGKTIQSIATLGLAYERDPDAPHSLVLAPRSVLLHWQREIQRCLPDMQVCRYHGPHRHPRMLQTERPTIFLTTYSTAANDIAHLVQVPFFYLLLDEATYIKNPSAKRTQAAKRINAAHRMALSGTPVENRPAELWSLFDFLMPGHLGRHATFVQEFEDAILAGHQQVARRLGDRIRPFMMRRTKEEVAKDLPDKIPMREFCELTEEQRRLYGGLQDQVKQVRDELIRRGDVNYTMSILPILQKLKQICDHPAIVNGEKDPLTHRSEKFDRVLDKIATVVEGHDQVVVFSQYLGMLDLIERWLRQREIAFIRIDGSTRHRQALVDRFDEGTIPVALCSLRAAGMGLNLQSANHVIHTDRWWNPAIEDQATDRVHRIGQEKTVYVYYFIIEGTLEERIDALLEKKREIADDIIAASTDRMGGWTREELLEILQPLEV